MNKTIRKSVVVATMSAFFFFVVFSFTVSYLCVRMTGSKYQVSIASAALDFAELTINADEAREAYVSRTADDSYDAVHNKLIQYQQNNSDSVSRISLISFSSTKGTFIYDTGDELLGAKLEYTSYLDSVKPELINGRSSFTRIINSSLEAFRPIRTVDDNLTGYIVVRLNAPYEQDYFMGMVLTFAGLMLLAAGFVFALMTFLNRKFFMPIRNLTNTAEYIASTDPDSFDANVNIVFEKNRHDEIGRLGISLEKMFFAMTSGEKNLNQAIYDANHDGMTHVYNKRCYHSMEDKFKNLPSICIIYFDVNNLKLMNDTLGHESGDYVIKRAADYIRSFTSDSDYCFRMGGDEFLLIMTDCSFRTIDSIIDKLETDCPYILNRDEDSVKCALSFGYSYAKGAYSYDALLTQAEENMYEKKAELKHAMQMPDR